MFTQLCNVKAALKAVQYWDSSALLRQLCLIKAALPSWDSPAMLRKFFHFQKRDNETAPQCQDSSVMLRQLCDVESTVQCWGSTSVLRQSMVLFFSYIFLGFFVLTEYLCRPLEASTGYCVIPGGYPPQDWQNLLCAGEELDSNPGLLICSLVHYHWATSPPDCWDSTSVLRQNCYGKAALQYLDIN